MKPDALRHLLLAAARSARRLVPAADAARIDAMALTLTVTRPERGRYRITWSAAEGAAAPAEVEMIKEKKDEEGAAPADAKKAEAAKKPEKAEKK